MLSKSKKEQKIREENIKKLDEQIRKSKKIPKEYKKKIRKQTILNVVTVLCMVIYLVSINILSLYLETETYLKTIKILSVILAVISIVYFELSYRKDNEKLFLYGTEVLIISMITLFSTYAYFIYFDTYNKILGIIAGVFVLYYLIKILIIRSRMKKQYYKEQNVIKEIIKK